MLCSNPSLTSDCRERLIQAAAQVFMEEGYRASVDRIASRAGVAKQTIYNHFQSKDELFGEVIRQGAASILVTLDQQDGDLRAILLSFAAAFSEKVLGPIGLSIARSVFAEAARMPDLAAACFRNGPEETVGRLTSFVAVAMTSGQLRKADPREAAEQLIGLIYGFERTRRLFGQPPSSERTETARLSAAIDCFLRAYAPERIYP